MTMREEKGYFENTPAYPRSTEVNSYLCNLSQYLTKLMHKIFVLK